MKAAFAESPICTVGSTDWRSSTRPGRRSRNSPGWFPSSDFGGRPDSHCRTSGWLGPCPAQGRPPEVVHREPGRAAARRPLADAGKGSHAGPPRSRPGWASRRGTRGRSPPRCRPLRRPPAGFQLDPTKARRSTGSAQRSRTGTRPRRQRRPGRRRSAGSRPTRGPPGRRRARRQRRPSPSRASRTRTHRQRGPRRRAVRPMPSRPSRSGRRRGRVSSAAAGRPVGLGTPPSSAARNRAERQCRPSEQALYTCWA